VYKYSWSGSLAESIYPRPSVRMNAVISETKTGYDIGIRHADSRDCCAG